MKFLLIILVLTGSVSLSQAKDLTYEEQIVYMQQDEKSANVESVPFDWKNCDANLPVQLISFDLHPDPIDLPGNVSLSFTVQSDVSIKAPFKVAVTVKKKIALSWFKVPCVDNVGSCTYDDVCQMVAQYQCPPEFKKYKIPCQCPIKSGSYALPGSEVPVTFRPSSLEKGSYSAEVRMYQGDTEVGCVSMHVSVV